MITFCPKHFTLEDVDCEEPIVACPPRLPFDPDRHIIISCGPCNRQRVVPVANIMKGKVQSSGMCSMDICAATLVQPTPEIKVETKTEYVEKAIPEGHIVVNEEVYHKAVREAELAREAFHPEDTKENPGHDPDTGSKAGTGMDNPNRLNEDVAKGINQAAPSRPNKGKATSGPAK